MRDGILAWNRAFAAAGIDDAIVVEDAPTKDYDPNDLRYNVIRWSTTEDVPFWAYGPSEADPRTGELLHAQVIVIADLFRQLGSSLRVQANRAGGCAAEAAGQLALGRLVGIAGGLDAQTGPYLRELMMHELGYTLGLRHNFRASSSIPYDKLHDKEFLKEHTYSASVMDYTFLNLGPDPSTQDDLFLEHIGDYDMFAIAYGYSPLPTTDAEEATGLAKLASASSGPFNGFATDEDTHLGPWTVDPADSAWDEGDDPYRFASDRLVLMEKAIAHLPDALVHDGQPWGPVRENLTVLLDQRTRLLTNAMRVIGGAHLRRSHRGDPGTPMTPIAAADQRKMLELVLDRSFSESAFQVPVDVLAVATVRRSQQITDGDVNVLPLDLPVHQLAKSHQRALMNELFSTVRLNRVVDNQVHVAHGTPTFGIAKMFSTSTTALFKELDAAKPTISTMRRNVERLYVDELVELLWAPETGAPAVDVVEKDLGTAPPPAPPGDARAAARHELVDIAKRAAKAVASARVRAVVREPIG